MSLASKHNEMINLHRLLDFFIKTHTAITDETKDRKNRILSYAKPLYNEYLNAYKKNYDSGKVKDEEKRELDYKRFKIIDNRDQGPKSTKKEETETNKPLWAKINKNDFN